MKIVVTGAAGFIGRNLVHRVRERRPDEVILPITIQDTATSRRDKLSAADMVFHLAGSNRPERVEEFREVNQGLTAEIVRDLVRCGRTPPVVFASSTQAEYENYYGRSKREGEVELEQYAREHGGTALIYRLTNVFGKWSRPDYNSVVATFCFNIARQVPIEIHDPAAMLRLVHVDDVVDSFARHIDEEIPPGVHRPEAGPVYDTTIQALADRLRRFASIRSTLELPDLSDRFTRLLHSTYVSFMPVGDLAYPLTERIDDRGKLAELLKSDHAGQVFVSTTRPGVIRGNHYHHRKVEKFCVLSGEAAIRFRAVDGKEIREYAVSGDRLEVVDIPPGYTHHIENVGDRDMVVLFWASEVFDPSAPDTRYLDVNS